MSSSFPNAVLRNLGWALCATMLCALAATRGAWAQQIVFVPQGSVTAEYATNRTLATPPVPDSADFQVQAGGDLKADSQVASFDLRPLLSYIDDTKIKNLTQYEALVDLVSAYRTQKAEWGLEAEYQRQDAFNAEYGVAVFNPLNPNAPNTQGTGFIVTGDTRTSFDVEPKFSYDMTQRWSLSGDAAFDAARYSTDIPGYLVSFNSETAELDMGYAITRESTVAAGPYYNNYQPTNDNVGAVREHGYGFNVNYNYKVSQITSTKVTVRVERDTTPAAYGFAQETLTAWSAEWTGTHKFLTSQVQFSVGRFLQPSSFGGRTSVDQFRVQYSRTFTHRLSGTVAVRVTRNTDIGDTTTEDSGNRDRAQLQTSLGYLITEELTLSGGYRFAYQALPAFDTTATGAVVSAGDAHAHSNAIFLTVTYHGRDATRQ